MLYIGLVVGVVVGSFMTIIFLALSRDVSVEQESGVSTYQVIKHNNDLVKRDDSLHLG